MGQMTRDEAQLAYVKAIILRGNPEFFVWAVVRRWNDEELIESLEEMGIHVDEIEDEE
jgi:hypothetical protein